MHLRIIRFFAPTQPNNYVNESLLVSSNAIHITQNINKQTVSEKLVLIFLDQFA